MRVDAVWSGKYGAYVAPSNKSKEYGPEFLSKCVLVITESHFVYLEYKGEKIKELSFKEFLKYKRFVGAKRGAFVI